MSSDITVEKVISKLTSRFQPDAAKGMSSVFQFVLEDGDDFFIHIDDQTCTPEYGQHDDPSIVLRMDSATFIRVVTGQQDGMSAFLKGNLRAVGNVMLATKLSKLFKA